MLLFVLHASYILFIVWAVQAARLHGWINEAKDAGCDVLVGGDRRCAVGTEEDFDIVDSVQFEEY